MTIRDALRSGAERLRQRPDIAEDAQRDAAALLEIATGLSRVAMRAHPEQPITSGQQERYLALLDARLQGTPMQHLRGSQEFYGRSFAVNGDVLIPRPETELLIDETLRRVDRDAPLCIADVGTGSGILAITLALELPRAQLWAFDISPAALAVARTNAQANHAMERIRFFESDLLDAARDQVFDLIVSNPPYVPLAERDTLHPQVREYEPALALFAGRDGYDVYRRLIPQAREHLRPGGWLLLETAGTANVLMAMMEGWTGLETASDLHGRPRVIAAHKP